MVRVRKYLALLLVVALSVTSIDMTAYAATLDSGTIMEEEAETANHVTTDIVEVDEEPPFDENDGSVEAVVIDEGTEIVEDTGVDEDTEIVEDLGIDEDAEIVEAVGIDEGTETVEIGDEVEIVAEEESVVLEVADASELLAYEAIDASSVRITGFTGTSEVDLVIPAEIDGKAVTEIASSAFASNAQIISVVIPGSVTKMGAYAFANTKVLEKVIFEDAAEPTMEGIYFEPDGNGYSKVFEGSAELKEIVLSNNVVTIPRDFASGCNKLQTLTLPESVTTIADGAFKVNGNEKLSTYLSGESECISSHDWEGAENRVIKKFYRIVFEPNTTDTELTGNMIEQPGEVGTEMALNCNGYIRPGYTFSGWNTAADGSGTGYEDQASFVWNDSDKPNGYEITLYAMWTQDEYSVVLDANGGLLDGNSAVEMKLLYGETVTKPTEEPTYEGFIFHGWFNGDTEYDFNQKVSGNLTIVAKWGLKRPKSNVDTSAPIRKGTKVSLFSETRGVDVYYTCDPAIGAAVTTENGILFDNEITISKDTMIYAIAYKENFVASPAITFTYTVLDESLDFKDITAEDVEAAGFVTEADVPNSLWIAGVSDQDFTGKAITFPDLHVYFFKTRLVEGKDYTVKYTNNTKAGVATITITGKGNYTGKIVKKFNINKLSFGDGETTSANLNARDIILLYNKKVQAGTTTVTYKINGTDVKLKAGTDYTYLYDVYEDYRDIGTYTVTIVGKGNYTGTATFTERIISAASTSKLISKLKFAAVPNQAATGYEIEPDVKISDGNKVLVKDTDYTLVWQNNVSVGTGTIIVTGKGKYIGTKVVTFKIIGIPMSKVSVTGLTNKNYTGMPTSQSGYRLFYVPAKDEAEVQLTEGVDYTVSYLNEVNAGKEATIVFTGKGKYTGVLKKTYAISAATIKDSDVTPLRLTAQPYAKGGVKPEVTVKVGGKELVKNVDYTLSYSYNTSVNNGSNPSKKPTITIKGKGNYKGTVSRSFIITPSSLDYASIKATDVVYARKAGLCKPSISLYDTNGNKLAAGTDYDKKITYTYAKDVTVERKSKNTYTSVVKLANTPVDLKKDIIPVGAEIQATVTGIKNYAGSSKSVVFRYVKADINKAKVTISNYDFTGEDITLCRSDIKVILGKQQLETKNYEIVSYSKNKAKGKASVTIRGIGNYGGTKTVSFNIVARSMSYTIVYDKNASDAKGSMKKSVLTTGTKLSKNAYSRAGYVFAGWSTEPDGSGVCYTQQEVFELKNNGYQVTSYGNVIRLYANWKKR